jgi:1,4-dihydroxy-2-naphthoate octaprenyltransferase
MDQISRIISLARPIQLLFAMLTYGLGLGLARYLGATQLIEMQFLGGVIVILLLAASSFLTEYFRPPNEPINIGETRKEREELRSIFLIVSASFLASVAFLLYWLSKAGFFQTEAIFITAIFILLALANAVPPLRLVNRGLGELSTSIQISSLSPALAFVFQFGSLHRLLTIYTFPLLLLGLSYFLALNFPAYAEDLKYERKSLLLSLTWQRAVPIYHALLAGTYIFFTAIPIFGVSVELVWPTLLTLPLAAYQIFALQNLADGAKPNWSVFIAVATAIFGITTYLIALTFWLR